MLGDFTPWSGNPVLRPSGDGWQSGNVYNPAAVVRDDQVVHLYRAHAVDRVSRLGFAVSDDGLHFECEPEPVLEPTEDYETRGCEDPRVTAIDDTYYLTYTGYNGFSALLCLATSTDLRSWTKHGPLFPDLDTWSTLAWVSRVRGLWHMYVGEGAIYHATSTDLLTWQAGEAPVLQGRPGSWDQDLIEVGAPPVVVGDRLVMLVNGATITSVEDMLVDYRCGQVAFALEDPATLIARDDEPFLAPTTPEEKAGLVPNVTFVEGLVSFRGQWLAYYGQSDTTTAVAIAHQ